MVTYPRDWDESEIGSLFNVSAGGDVDKSCFSRNKTLNNSYEIYSNGVDNRGLYGYTSKPLYQGDSITVTARGTIGRAFYREAPYDAIIRLLVLSPLSKDACSSFYTYYINNNVVFEDEHTGVPQLTAPKIRKVKVPKPPRPEQEAIAETLSCMDEHIANLTELIEKKKAIRDGALEDLVSGRTRLRGFSGEWDTRCVGECAYIYSGGTPKTSNPNYWNGNVVWITPGEITNNKGLYIHTSERKITVDGVNNSSATLLPKGTILLCTRATIGYLAIADTELATNQGFKNLVCKPDIDNVFFAYALMTKRTEMVTKAIGTTFLEISKKALSGIEMRIPLLPEQQAISSVLTAMDEEILALEEEKDKMLQIKAGAMDDLLTGQIRLAR